MVPSRVIFPLFLMLAFLVGCGDSKEITEQRAKLELAELKGDLDAIYLSLNKLVEAGDNNAKSRLENISTAIKLREKMALSLSDHNHESALLYATKLLEKTSNNKEAKHIVRDSGQILYYMLSANEMLSTIKLKSEDIIVEPEVVVLNTENTKEESHKELTTIVQKSLISLNYDVGKPDGVSGKKTIEAVKKIQNKNGLKQTGEITIKLANELYKTVASEKEKELKEKQRTKDSEMIFENLKKAKKYVEEAKEIDPHFKRLLELDKLIEQTQSTLVYILGAQIVESGKITIASAASIYGSVSELLSMAVSSEYMTVQSAWSSIQEPVNNAKKELEPILDEMDNIGRLLGTYEEGPAIKFVEATQNYIKIVRKAVDALMVPNGSYRDYSRDANNAATMYKDAQNDLVASIPTSISIKESSAGLIKIFSDFKVFENKETIKIIESNIAMYKI